jgi:hypothetical protein
MIIRVFKGEKRVILPMRGTTVPGKERNKAFDDEIEPGDTYHTNE